MRSTLLTLILATVAAAAAAAAAATASLAQRDLPVDHGCAPCVPDDGPYYTSAVDALAKIDTALIVDARHAHVQKWPADYIPPLCNIPPVKCLTLGIGVNWTGSMGMTGPLGTWPREDQTTIMAWRYWQSTVQFVGAGGSVTAYMAHCTDFLCAKGRIRIDKGVPGDDAYGSVSGDGVPDDKAQNYCGCFPKDLNADLAISMFDPNTKPQTAPPASVHLSSKHRGGETKRTVLDSLANEVGGGG